LARDLGAIQGLAAGHHTQHSVEFSASLVARRTGLPHHSLGPDQEEMASPVPEEVADEQPEELVSGAKAGSALAPDGDLKLLA
jgi:hypothetical protein